jgi:hypothetical protein
MQSTILSINVPGAGGTVGEESPQGFELGHD